MANQRLEVRLDTERHRKLSEIAGQRGITLSALVREMIDRAFEDSERTERLRLVQLISEANVEDVPDPETLSRQLDETYALPDLP